MSHILLSGGSRGLGMAMARQMLGEGHRVTAFARSATDATRGLASETDAFHFLEADLTDEGAAGRIVAAAIDASGPITGLVNNAAMGQDHMLANMPVDRIDGIIDLNLTANILLTREVVRRMIMEGTKGRVVNITSICGSRGFPGLSVYSATKAALDGFTRALARELGSRGILVNSIAPGFFESEMSSILSEEQLQTIRRRTPTGKLVESSEILPVLSMLLHEDCAVTGQVIAIDGGASV